MGKILVTGGAGYVGSHLVKGLQEKGYGTVVFDNLIYGHRDAVKKDLFIHGDLADLGTVEGIFKNHSIDAVMHFSAYAYVGESVVAPEKYYFNNVVNTLNLLKTMEKYKVKFIIFSSTCATYGEPESLPISEEHRQNPISPYGRSKFMVEQILSDYGNAYDLQFVALRYFNAAGADPGANIGEDHSPETHLVPLILTYALEKSGIKKTEIGPLELNVFGSDYPTKDGTCIRDYIHVDDLATAHILALEYLFNKGHSDFFNLGNGKGFSVKEVFEMVRKITQVDIPMVFKDRRPGDPAVLVGSSEKAKTRLGWTPQLNTLEQIIQTAWKWHKNHPYGYQS